MENIKLIVAGSRSFDDYNVLDKAVGQYIYEIKETNLGKYLSIPASSVTIISGGAKGADSLAEVYADAYGFPFIKITPDWDTYGKRAGILRNIEMAELGTHLIAFWDGESKGTKHMIQHCYNSENIQDVRVVRV